MTEVINRYAIQKRTLDIVMASLGLIICAPIMLLIALLIWAKSGNPILYSENRIGLHQKPFKLYKFRSMETCTKAEGSSVASGDDPRILSYGHALRSSHLDELPQLWHVLIGQMSLVGPRPYKPAHFNTLPLACRRTIASVKPGLTGSDSLKFIAEDEALRGLEDPETTYLNSILPAKAELQMAYILRPSIKVDLRIILNTLTGCLGKTMRNESVHYLRSLFEKK